MCFATSRPPKKIIAEEDVPIFKIVRKINGIPGYFAYFMKKFNYNLGVKYRLSKYGDLISIEFKKTIEPQKNQDAVILYLAFDGFHSYSQDNLYIKRGKYTLSVKSKELDSIQDWFLSKDLRIAEGIIPKGSVYYKNERGECISEEIILTKIRTKKTIPQSGIIKF